MTGSLINLIKLTFCLFVLLLIVSCKQETVIVAADGIIKSKTEMEYRIVLLESDKKPSIVNKFKDPVEIIWSSKTEFAYIDHQGDVWEVSLSDLSPRLLLNTGYLRNEDTIGKFILKRNEKKLYYAINSYPPSSVRTYSLNCVPFGGKRRTLFAGEGRVYAIKQLSDNNIQMVTSAKTIDINISSGKIIRSSDNTKGSRIIFHSAHYAAHQKYDNYRNHVVEIFNHNLIDKPAMHYRMDKGFGIPFDLDESSMELLLVEVRVSSDKIPDRLVITNTQGTASEIYRSDIICSARFLISE